MLPGNYDMPSVTAGDTWGGLVVTSLEDSEGPLAVALASVKIYFRAVNSACAKCILSSPTEITITNAAAWAFTAAAQVLPLTQGDWSYEVELTDADGYKQTYLKGGLTIT